MKYKLHIPVMYKALEPLTMAEYIKEFDRLNHLKHCDYD
jgi:hypothetical protein